MATYEWPGASASTNPSVGPNGSPIPLESTLIAGVSAGNLVPVSVDPTGNVNVNIVSAAVLPPNAATATNQVLQLAQETSTATNTGTIVTNTASIVANQTNGTQTVSVLNFPATQPVSGTVAVSNFPATQPVSGTITANQGTSPWVENVSQWGGSATTLGQKVSTASVPVVLASDQSAIAVTGTFFQATQPVSGTVAVSNFPATQPVSGSVSVSNFPATQPVSGTVTANAGTPTALTITNAALTVGVTPIRLTVSGSAPSATRVALVATPDQASTAKFYIGNASVAVGTGPEISAGQVFIANNDAGDYYIISDTAAQLVECMEQA